MTELEELDIHDGCEQAEPIVLEKDKLIRGLLTGVEYENILMMMAWGKLFHWSIIESIDWSASNYRANEDEFMALQYYPMLEKAAIVPSDLYFYREENPASITITKYKNSFEQIS